MDDGRRGFVCQQCGDSFDVEYNAEIRDEDGDTFCEFCAKEIFVRCVGCDKYWDKDENLKSCPDCGEKLGGKDA